MARTLPDILPSPIFRGIQEHFRNTAPAAASAAWDSASTQEDAFTGDFCGALRSNWRGTVDPNSKEIWGWRVNYRKIRGQGTDAPESVYGADGAVLIEIELPDGTKFSKGLLFQGKMPDNSNTGALREQIDKMNEWVPGANSVWVYNKDGVRATEGHEWNRDQSAGRRWHRPRGKPVGDFLADEFLPCKIGQQGLDYDSDEEVLTVDGRPIPIRPKHLVIVDAFHTYFE